MMIIYSVDYIIEFLRLFPIFKIKSGRPPKFSDKWYLNQIFTVLRTGIQWRYLQTTIHYTTIFKKFVFYTKHDIFNRAYNYWLSSATFNLFISTLLADKGYNSIRLKQQTEQLGISLIFPAKINQKPNTLSITHLLKKRIIVERVFGWFKSYKKIVITFRF
ncbi:MAG: transposase [Candidatus Paceibacterota bacterium]